MKLPRGVLIVALALGLLAALCAAEAQEPGKVRRIRVLGPTTRSDSMFRLDAFREGLRELGWVEGRTVVLDDRWAEGRTGRQSERRRPAARRQDASRIGSPGSR
jgi:putative ABC transport system substrate-binding protein